MTLQEEFNAVTQEYTEKVQSLITKHTSKMYVNGVPFENFELTPLQAVADDGSLKKLTVVTLKADGVSIKTTESVKMEKVDEAPVHHFVNGINNEVNVGNILNTLVGETYLSDNDKQIKITQNMVNKLVFWLNMNGVTTTDDFKKLSIEEIFMGVGQYPCGLYAKVLMELAPKLAPNIDWLNDLYVVQNEPSMYQDVKREFYVRKVNKHRAKLNAAKATSEKEFMLEIERYRKCLSYWKTGK